MKIKNGFYDNYSTMRREWWENGKCVAFLDALEIGVAFLRPEWKKKWGAYKRVARRRIRK